MKLAIPSIGCAALFACFLGCGDSSSSDEGAGTSQGANGNGGTTQSGGGSPSTGGAPASGEPPELQGITAAHNEARANVDPPAATPIPPLTWDQDVAAVAQAYAENCVFEHSGGQYGENLYANTGSTTPQTVVDGWVSEVQFYDYDSNSCSDVCGHYTQVVWAQSSRLGCGVANCTANSPFGDGGPWQNWVCNYDPPGNYIGQKPY